MDTRTYQRIKKIYDADDFHRLRQEPHGFLFLKIRSIARKSLLTGFAGRLAVNPRQSTAALLQAVISHPDTEKKIDEFILSEFNRERSGRLQNQNKLISELYKLKVFDWGGLYQNNLERTIVDNYVKKINRFDTLLAKIDNEIHNSLRGYVLCSWYNHWTSILIEDIFKTHKRVLPAVGLIKRVDFFIDKTPFDLKVTYFPDGFMAMKRKEKGLKPELTVIKEIAKENRIRFDGSEKNKHLSDELLAKLSESHRPQVKKALADFYRGRQQIIREAMANKKELIRWLYEMQGERRFDAANRLFLVLIDKNNLDESWKLKRNIDFLNKDIRRYLNKLVPDSGLKITFNWKGNAYTAISDVLFVVKK